MRTTGVFGLFSCIKPVFGLVNGHIVFFPTDLQKKQKKNRKLLNRRVIWVKMILFIRLGFWSSGVETKTRKEN